MRLRTEEPDALNKPAKWDRYLKPWLDVGAWQKRIDAGCGLNKAGQSIVRLTWAQDATQKAFYEETPRYWTRRAKIDGKFIYWTVPRWIFESRLEREAYVPSWNDSRWSITDGEGRKVDKGPPPDEYFSYMLECARHEELGMDGHPACCTRAFYTDRSRCWGRYRPPSEQDLEIIIQSVRKMRADPTHDPYKPLTAEQVMEAEIAANKQVERAEEQLDLLAKEIQRDFLKTYPYPGALTNGRFMDLGSFNHRED